MARMTGFVEILHEILRLRGTARSAGLAAAILVACLGEASAQGLDCARLRARIAALDDASVARPQRYAAAARKQRAELDRTVNYARSLGCDQPEIPFFGRPLPARCPGLNAKITQMQQNLAQLEAADRSSTDGVRQDLIARYDAYCRNQVANNRPPTEQNFFEALFGGFLGAGGRPVPPAPIPYGPPSAEAPPLEHEGGPRGGSQAVCVRSCDGGFFPLDVSLRHTDPDHLANLCQALCPNADVSVFTRAPHSAIETAVALEDETAYSDLPNARKYQSSYDPSCSCKAPGQSWVEALAGAEAILGASRRGDIFVTPEKSVQLSRPTSDGKPPARAAIRSRAKDAAEIGFEAAPGSPSPSGAASETEKAPAASGAVREETREVTGPDGVTRRVRIIAPML